MNKFATIVLLFCLLLCAQNGLGQDKKAVGKIKDIKLEGKTGSAEVTRQSDVTQPASEVAPKDPVFVHDILASGNNTWASITFDDGGYLKMRNNARLEILSSDEIFLIKGEIFVNNKWNNKIGRRFKIKTKQVTGGTTGTQFVMSYSEENASTAVTVLKGKVTLESADSTIMRPDGKPLKDFPLVVRPGRGVTLSQDAIRPVPIEIFNQIRLELKSWSKNVEPREGMTPQDLKDDRLINLGGNIGSNFVPGQESSKPAEDAAKSGTPLGELALPPRPPNNL
jgi:FecR protein